MTIYHPVFFADPPESLLFPDESPRYLGRDFPNNASVFSEPNVLQNKANNNFFPGWSGEWDVGPDADDQVVFRVKK